MPVLLFLILICCVPGEVWSSIFEIAIFLFILAIFLSVLYLLLYTLYLSGPIGWFFGGVGVVFLISCLVSIDNKKREKELKQKKREIAHLKARENKKIACEKAKEQKELIKINDVKRSIVIFAKNSALYAIPLSVSHKNVILLHPTIINAHKPIIKFLEIKSSIDEIDLISDIPKDPEFHTIEQISSVAKDLYLNIDPQNKDLKSKLAELRRLEKLARFSELYKQQADLYSRASSQIQELLDIGENLSRECHTFILDILIGQELVRYNVDDMPDVLEIRLKLDDRCKIVSDRYQILKAEMDEYMNLKNGI